VSDLFHHLEHDVSDWFHHATRHSTAVTSDGDTITVSETQAPLSPGALMPLADTAAALQSSHASAKAELEEMLAKGHDVLDNHMTQLGTAIGDVAAVASIADSPLVAAAAGALHVPPEILDGFVSGLTALAKAFPKPGVPAEPAEAAPEPPAEPVAA
jgi:hypothetical protein